MYYTLPVRLSDGRVARLARHIEMDAFEREPGIPVVVKTVGFPFGGRAVTTVATDAVLFLELAAMNVLMARGAGG